MPKELIYDGQNHEGTVVEKAVQVSWDRDGVVEIASVNLSNEPYTPERGWFTLLDRKGINSLIKTLRKARDQAYGADE